METTRCTEDVSELVVIINIVTIARQSLDL